MRDSDTTLIKNAFIISNDPDMPSVFLGWVNVTAQKISYVGVGSPANHLPVDRVIDAKGNLLMPGLVNTHTHSHSSLTRGSAEGLPLNEWLEVIEIEQKKLTEEQEYIAALATYAEALLSGTTLISDMCYHPKAAYRAAEKIGIRTIISPYVAKTKTFTPTLEETRSLINLVGQNVSRIHVWCGLHDIENCGDEQIAEGGRLAKELGVGLHMHCAETEDEMLETQMRTGKRPVSHLYDLGILKKKTLLAHCVWVDEEEIRLLSDNGTNVAHCPHSNLKLGSGIAPVREMIDAGINVTLGTDGAKSNNRLDMFDVMKFASLLHKGVHRDPTVLPPKKVLYMATRAGAEALNIDAGIIAKGALADLILIKSDNLHLQPLTTETAITNIVHSARGSDVDLVMVAGNIVVKDSKLLTINYNKLLNRVKIISKELMSY